MPGLSACSRVRLLFGGLRGLERGKEKKERVLGQPDDATRACCLPFFTARAGKGREGWRKECPRAGRCSPAPDRPLITCSRLSAEAVQERGKRERSKKKKRDRACSAGRGRGPRRIRSSFSSTSRPKKGERRKGENATTAGADSVVAGYAPLAAWHFLFPG